MITMSKILIFEYINESCMCLNVKTKGQKVSGAGPEKWAVQCVQKPAGARRPSGGALEEDVDSWSAEDSGRQRQDTCPWPSLEDVGAHLGNGKAISSQQLKLLRSPLSPGNG